jgi:hypothetical protein
MPKTTFLILHVKVTNTFKSRTIKLLKYLSNNYENIYTRTKVQIQNAVTLKIL